MKRVRLGTVGLGRMGRAAELDELRVHVLGNADIGARQPSSDAATAPLEHPEFSRYSLDIPTVAEVWRRGGVVGSWLLDLTAAALLESPGLHEFSGRASDSGKGRWTAIAATGECVPTPVMTAALTGRFGSRGLDRLANQPRSAMRKHFGGHAEKPAGG